MKLTINRVDGVVGIDGLFLPIDLSLTSNKLRVVQWDDTVGHEEWIDRDNTEIANLDSYMHIVNAWNAAKLEIDKAADPYYGMTAEQILAAKEMEIRQKYDNQLSELGRPYLETSKRVGQCRSPRPAHISQMTPQACHISPQWPLREE